MTSSSQLTLLADDGQETDVSVFIHGYRAISSASQFNALRQWILSARPAGQIYLLHWKSGNWTVTRAAAVARGTYRAGRVARFLSPWSLAFDVGILATIEAAQFKVMERRSEWLGENLQRHLGHIPNGKQRPIHLIGHSLGARVIHAALAKSDWSDYLIHDCVFLAGAADLESDDWPRCLRQIHGRLYNGYSVRDGILRITPDFRKRVGRYPMPQVVIDGYGKVVNKNCGRFGHTEYWQRLDYILPKVWPGFPQYAKDEALRDP